MRIASENKRLRLGAVFWCLSLATHIHGTLGRRVLLKCLSLTIPNGPGRAQWMSYQALREYLMAIVDRYKKLDRKGKTVLLFVLDYFCKLLD